MKFELLLNYSWQSMSIYTFFMLPYLLSKMMRELEIGAVFMQFSDLAMAIRFQLQDLGFNLNSDVGRIQ